MIWRTWQWILLKVWKVWFDFAFLVVVFFCLGFLQSLHKQKAFNHQDLVSGKVLCFFPTIKQANCRSYHLFWIFEYIVVITCIMKWCRLSQRSKSIWMGFELVCIGWLWRCFWGVLAELWFYRTWTVVGFPLMSTYTCIYMIYMSAWCYCVSLVFVWFGFAQGLLIGVTIQHMTHIRLVDKDAPLVGK